MVSARGQQLLLDNVHEPMTPASIVFLRQVLAQYSIPVNDSFRIIATQMITLLDELDKEEADAGHLE